MPYEHDVFLSYSRKGEWPDWVREKFLPLLRHWLGEELGREPGIFFDQDIESIIASQPITTAIERHEGQLNERQRAILEHVNRTGSVTSGWCRTTFGKTYDTANRDLNGLVELGLLKRTGAGRSTAYRSPEKSPETTPNRQDTP